MNQHDELSPDELTAVAGGKVQHVAIRAVMDALDDLKRRANEPGTLADHLMPTMMQMMMARRG